MTRDITCEPIKSNYTVDTPQYVLLPTTLALKKYGIPKSSALYMMQNFWAIKKEFLDIFDTYSLLYCSIKRFSSILYEGCIIKDSIKYQVRFYRCDSYKILQGSKSIKLSFRALKAEYEAMPTVLVTLA